MQKTPTKLDNEGANNQKTPEKVPAIAPQENNVCTPVKETEKPKQLEFRTPEKVQIESDPQPAKTKVNVYKTPEKQFENQDSKLEQTNSCDGDIELISTIEQARLLLAAKKTPSKSGDRTPAKQSTPSGKRSIENSPGTPGKFRRVELITLASPKAKRVKQM